MSFERKTIEYLRSIERNTKCSSCNGENITTLGGVNSSIPEGLRSVSIVKTSSNLDTVTITLSNGSTYILTEQGETFFDSLSGNSTLPSYTIAGPGTWKWHGII